MNYSLKKELMKSNNKKKQNPQIIPELKKDTKVSEQNPQNPDVYLELLNIVLNKLNLKKK